ncbi:MAG TPA: LamG-like jellyroll fold domain-containing protein [Anaerolineae bacterium]|nr:LamG-like jellyroll fold domain-containing protein [Anaerolineae bacterium]
MKKTNRFYVVWSVLILFMAVGVLWTPTSAAEEETAAEAVAVAWQRATDSDRYQYRSQIEQTTYPVPSLRHAGQQAERDTLALEGQVEPASEQMEMTLWMDGSFAPERGMAVRIQNGKAEGRMGEGEWQSIENVGDLFAPGGDPLSFLAGADNIVLLGAETRAFAEGVQLTYHRYRFDLNGPAFARYLQKKMQADMVAEIGFDPGLQFDMNSVYARLEGNGEVWLTANGLPARLLIDMELPAQGADGRVVAHLKTDYFDYRWPGGGVVSEGVGSFGEMVVAVGLAMRQQMPTVFGVMVLIGLGVLLVSYWQSSHFYAVVAVAVIMSMLLTPLLEGYQVYGYWSERDEGEVALAARTERVEAMDEMRAAQKETVDPHQDPLAAPLDFSGKAGQNSSQNNGAETGFVRPNLVVDLTDTDGDGLTDADEAEWRTCPSNASSDPACDGVVDAADTDGDGIKDGVEAHQLTTLPSRWDTDGDSITDTLEINGFFYNGKQWYLNPQEADSNKDGLIDADECPNWTKLNPDIFDPGAPCPDSDGDGTPDVWDDDNDNDGVIDGVDISPNSKSDEIYNGTDAPFALSVDNLAVDKPVYVDLHFRPTDAKHLTFIGNVLDWPGGDVQGQIQRELDTTFANSINPELRSNEANAGYGDIRLVPLMEVFIPYTPGHYGNLPVKPAYQGVARTLEMSLDWLDESKLRPYGISVREAADGSGDLYMYLPLSLVADDTGGGRVAFSTHMLYWPSQGSWGSAHEHRVSWMVQMLTDSCVATNGNGDCTQYTEELDIIHVYEEEWYLTGLSVSEEHGTELMILYEDPAQDADLSQDHDIWAASWNLANIFLRGRDCDTVVAAQCQGDGQRDVTLANMNASINSWSGGADVFEASPTFSYDHVDFLTHVMMTETVRLLDAEFTPYATQTDPTLLMAREDQSRRHNVNHMTMSSPLTVDMDPTNVPKITRAFLNWGTYDYVAGEWQLYNNRQNMERLKQQLSQISYFQPADSSEESQFEAQGKLLWAQMYYANLMQGISHVVLADDALFWSPTDEIVTEITYGDEWPTSTFIGAAFIAEAWATVLSAALPNILANGKIFPNLGRSFAGNVSITKYLRRHIPGGQTFNNVFIGGTAVVAWVGLGLLIAGMATGNDSLITTGEIILNALTIVVVVVVAVNLAIGLAAATGTTVAFSLAQMSNVSRANQVFTGVTFIVTVVVIWGMFIVTGMTTGLFNDTRSLDYKLALAYTIASTIVAFIFLIIANIPVIGNFIVLAIWLTDALLYFICDCKGVQAYMTEAIANFIFDVDVLIKNLTSSDRLQVNFEEFALSDPLLGFVEANGLRVTLGVTNTIEYRSDFSNSEAKSAVFRYWLQQQAMDRHEDLGRNDMRGDWSSQPGRFLQTTANAPQQGADIPFASVGTGINRDFGDKLYLTESFVAPYKGCWELIWEIECTWYEQKDSIHMEMGSYVVFDILPNTLTEFWSGGWTPANGLPFGNNIDYDNDGLTRRVDASDIAWDSDGDGLGDFFELSQGTNMLSADNDGDGLTDAQELRYNLDPNDADMDNDGFSDKQEWEGWRIIYDYDSGGNPLYTQVWPSPYDADSDEDGLTDREEYYYGLNPWYANGEDEILDTIQFEAGAPVEVASPAVLLRFEAPANATVFIDSAGQDDLGSCVAGRCPQTAVLGRYGYGLDFDGIDDYVEAPYVVNPSGSNFTAALWFKIDNTTENQLLLAQSNGSGTGRAWLYVNSGTGQLATTLGGSTLTGGSVVAFDEWHHAAVSYNGSTLNLYLNGSLVASNNRSLESSTGVMYLGNNSLLTNAYDGQLDEFVLYDYTLTTSAVADLVNAHYNVTDLIVTPGDTVQATMQISNTNSAWPAQATYYAQTDENFVRYVEGPPSAQLRLDEAAGSSSFAIDYLGGNAGCYNQCPTAGVAGAVGTAVAFDGGDGINFDAVLNNWSGNGFTIGGWFRIDSGVNNDPQTIFALTKSGGSGLSSIHEWVRYYPQYNEVVILGTATTWSGNVSRDQWHHLMIAIDTASKTRFVYFNGQLVTTGLYGEPGWQANGGPVNNGRLRLGTLPNGVMSGYTGFKGQLDDFFVYNRLLSEGDVQALLNDEPLYVPVQLPIDSYAIPTQDSVSIEQSLTIPPDHTSTSFIWQQIAEAALNVDDPYRVVMEPVVRVHFDERPNPWPNYNGPGWELNVYTKDSLSGTGAQTVRCIDSCPLVSGIAGLALEVDGVDTWVRLLELPLGNAGWTVSSWIYPTHTDNTIRPIFGKRWDGNLQGGPSLYITADDKLGFAFHDGTIWNTNYTPGGSIPRNEWSHVAVTYDGSGNYQTYLNGLPVGDDTAIQGLTPSLQGDLNIGYIDSSYLVFEGLIDNFTAYSVGLDANQVAGIGSWQDLALHLHYTFDEPPGSNVLLDNGGVFGDGSCSNCPLLGIRGVSNRAGYFEGNDLISSTDIPAYWGWETGKAEDFAIVGWIQVERGRIMENRSAYKPFRLWTNRLDSGWDFDRNAYGRLYPFSSPPVAEWAHLVVTHDASGSEDGIYINGVEVLDLMATTPDEANGTNPLQIGQGLVGYIDDLRLYNRPFTASDVQSDYDTSVPQLQIEFEEESETTTFADSSRNRYVGTINDVIPGVNGRIGRAGTFSGTGYVDMGVVPEVTGLANDFTIMAWVRPDDLGQSQYIIASDRSNTGGNGWGFYMTGAGRLGFLTYGVSSNSHVTSDPVVTADRWQHVALTMDRSNTVYFYVDGVLVHTSAGDAAIANLDDPLMIGRYVGANGVPDYYFDGQIDDLFFYNRSLSSVEVDSAYINQFRWFRRQQNTYLMVDNDVPTITLFTDDSYWANAYTQLVVGTEDATSAVWSFEFGLQEPGASSLRWQSAAPCADAVPGRVWCPAFDPAEWGGEGKYQLQFRAVDAVGNETLSPIYTLFVDDTPPVVSTAYNGDWRPMSASSLTPLRWSLNLSGTVNDPGIGADAGSGVDETTVLVSLVDAQGRILGDGPQLATVTGSNWSVDYDVQGERPSGSYDLHLVATDNVGNEINTAAALNVRGAAVAPLGSLQLDEHPPTVHVDPYSLPGYVITQTTVVSGVIVDTPDWGGQILAYHFEESIGATAFTDYSQGGHDGSCINCPATAMGVFGQGLQFAGGNDLVSVPHVLDPITSTFTAALWFNVNDLNQDHTMLQQEDGTGIGRSWLYVYNNGELSTYLGGSRLGGGQVTPGVWHHGAVVYDGITLRLYLDGVLVATRSGPLESSDGQMRLGLNKSDGTPLVGLLDEVSIWERPLSEQEIHALAQKDVSGVEQTYINLRPSFTQPENPLVYLPFGDKPDTAGWYNDGLESLTATCVQADSCPLVVDGIVGQGAHFDTDEQRISIADEGDLLDFRPDQDFTIALWALVDDVAVSTHIQAFLFAKFGTSNVPYGMYYHTYGVNEGHLGMWRYDGVTSSQMGSSQPINDGQYHHLVFMKRGEMLYFYLDGQLDNMTPDLSTQINDSPYGLSISFNNDNNNFRGYMDEFYVFDRALGDNEISALFSQQPGLPMMTNSAAATSNWQYTIAEGWEDFYQIDMWGTDMYSNSSHLQTIWRGIVDTRAPRIQFAGEHLGYGPSAQTEFSYKIDDLFLDSTTITHPCADADLRYDYYPEPVSLRGATATCRLPGHQTGTFTVSACDQYNHCTTETVVLNSSAPVDVINILTPAPQTMFNATDPILIDGGAYVFDSLGINKVEIFVNGILLESIKGDDFDGLWETTWTPTQLGETATIVAVMTTGSGNILSDTIQIGIWPPAIPPQLSIAISDTADIDLNWTLDEANCTYAIYESDAPYGQGNPRVWGLSNNVAAYLYPNEVADGENRYYMVEAYGCGGQTAVSNQVGKFEVPLYR